MKNVLPVQEFQIGQRVRSDNEPRPFIVAVIANYHGSIWYSGHGRPRYLGSEIALCPERPPYVPSERLVVGRMVTIARYQPEIYRCETDAEMAARHAVEQAAYDAQGE